MEPLTQLRCVNKKTINTTKKKKKKKEKDRNTKKVTKIEEEKKTKKDKQIKKKRLTNNRKAEITLRPSLQFRHPGKGSHPSKNTRIL